MPDGNTSVFQACVRTPFATLGITATDRYVTGIRFLAPSVRGFAPPRDTIAFLACVQLQSYLFIALIALTAVIVLESVLLARRVKRIVLKRFPKTEQRMGGLYWYAIQRSIMPRSMRNPRPRMSYKAKEDDLGKVVK